MADKPRSKKESELARTVNDPKRIRREKVVQEAERIARKAAEERRRRG